MYILTQEQADVVIRILGFDGQVDESQFVESVVGPFYHYFLDDGTIIEIGPDCQVQHQALVEDPEDGLVPVDMKDVEGILGPDVGVVELRKAGRTVGLLDWFNADAATPEQRHIHDLRVLDITERAMRDGH